MKVKQTKQQQKSNRRQYKQKKTMPPFVSGVSYSAKPHLKVFQPKENTNDGILVSPPQDLPQIFGRRDYQVFDFHVKRCHTESTFQNDANPQAQYRIHWVLPEATTDSHQSGASTFYDKRGIISEVRNVSFIFKNLLHDEITLAGNVPHGRIGDPEVIVNRTKAFKKSLRPGQTYKLNISKFGDKNNTIGPLIVQDHESTFRAMGLLDFTCKVADVNVQTGAAYNPDRVAYSVQVYVNYNAMEHFQDEATSRLVARPEFGVIDLPSLAAMDDVTPITIDKQAVKALAAPGPVWIHAEKGKGGYLTIEERTHDGTDGYVFCLVHSDHNGKSMGDVIIPSEHSAEACIFVPGLSVITSEDKRFSDAVFIYDKRTESWLVADPSDPTGFLTRAVGAYSTKCIVPATVPMALFSDIPEVPEVRAAGVDAEKFVAAMTTIINVVGWGIRIASVFM